MIDGERVRLRAMEPEDAERGYKWINDREVTRTLMARYPFSLVAEREFLQNAAKALDFHDVRLAIETKEGAQTGGRPPVHIGFCGLHRGSAEDRHAELGIMIGDKEYWDQGYGSDAMMAVLRFAFFQMNLHKVSLGVFELNPRAQAVYRKCGFVEEGRRREEYYQDGRYWDVIWMSVLRREFDALHGPAQVAEPAQTANSIAGA